MFFSLLGCTKGASPSDVSTEPPYVRRTLGRLLDLPGVFVWGSNDYFAPTFRNPLLYLTRPERRAKPKPVELPWRDLRREFAGAGWVELTNSATTMTVGGVRIGLRGTDDAHLGQERYSDVAGPVDRSRTDLAIGVTHAPYASVIDPMTADGLDLTRPVPELMAWNADLVERYGRSGYLEPGLVGNLIPDAEDAPTTTPTGPLSTAAGS